MNALVPKELAAKLSALPRRPCALGEAGHEPHKPVFAEILDRSGHGTGHFVRLPQSMVEMITREAKAPEPVQEPAKAPASEPEAAAPAAKPRRKPAGKRAPVKAD
ncbi:hypothetical protein NS228_04230 [Methylobacterium indicum]|uniref:hypothetical protein n=1 Tax=Methylobacterium indicum TaxID=1775910 RepID=UPI000734D60A|nr:hypothetical protein [Methylobacterium indicum]KTS30597.1 hypothetical protein NS229_15680 [Methylobacterium indicum]KTS41926.1 hypothetical protein NS228_04230 [Methylobacterium indicum]KTS52187.1 hypothetical protein NS230_11050 [Methylobacterium indicum]